MDREKQFLSKEIQKNIERRLGCELCTIAREEVEALAYACTFHNARRFSNMVMDGREWNALADTLTPAELMNVHSATKKCRPGANRLFFILGCFARAYGGRVSSHHNSGYQPNFNERHYTKAELNSVVVNIDNLKYEDIFGKPFKYVANFNERHYTKEELNSVVTKIEDLKDEDL